MAGLMELILIMQVSFGLLIIAQSVPLALRKIGPNSWCGFRVRGTMEDPVAWYDANAFAGKALIGTGSVMVVGSMVLYLVPVFDGPSYAVARAVITLVALGVATISTFRFLGRIAKPTDR